MNTKYVVIIQCNIRITSYNVCYTKLLRVDHNFVVKNIGKSNLIIRKVKASCGCTATNPEKTVLAPGESTNIKTTFNSKGKSGRQNKSVTVVTNDPKSTSTMLRLTGNVTVE